MLEGKGKEELSRVIAIDVQPGRLDTLGTVLKLRAIADRHHPAGARRASSRSRYWGSFGSNISEEGGGGTDASRICLAVYQ